MKKSITGLVGADCVLCESRATDWSDEEKVEEGFELVRTAEVTMAIYNQVVKAGGTIRRKAGDWDTRKGVTTGVCVLHTRTLM